MNLLAWNRDEFLGKNFPVKPLLCREGFYIESFLETLFIRIIYNRTDLVQNSNEFYSFNWFFKFRDLINDSISSLDVFLHLIYTKAQYNKNNGWTFDVNELGSKFGRRLKDKIKWISQISGKQLNIEKYKDGLTLIKELRNHLNHFDPPSFCLTAEECPKILNAILDVGMIHIEMRKILNLNVSTVLINLILQLPVIFTPEEIYKKRAEFKSDIEGYGSCKWPIKE